jgi:hypothetical protein
VIADRATHQFAGRLEISYEITVSSLIHDKPVNGTMAAYEDGFSALELSRKYYREADLNPGQLDLRIR